MWLNFITLNYKNLIIVLKMEGTIQDSNTVFDVFQSVKSLLYLGNYSAASEESSSTDINEEDISQVVRTYFYIFISCIEDEKKEELNNLLFSLKDAENEQLKIYYNIFIMYTFYIYKNQFNDQRFNKLYNDLKSVKTYDPILFPAIYIISLILLDKNENELFLSLIEKYEQDIEILGLKFYYLFKMNKVEDMRKVLGHMYMKEPDSIIYLLCMVVYKLYAENNFTEALTLLGDLNKNNKLTVKLYNFIGISLMSKGMFGEALKILEHGKDFSEKNGLSKGDYNTVLVNLITVYRNIGKDTEVAALEQILHENNPKNDYFKKLENFEKMFEEIEKKKK
jgi:hypothetical protein